MLVAVPVATYVVAVVLLSAIVGPLAGAPAPVVAPSALPHPAQKCSPGAPCRPQLVQKLLGGGAVWLLAAGILATCTGVPQF